MKKSLFTLALCFCLAGAMAVNAQDHVFTVGSASGNSGDTVQINVTYSNNSAADVIQGYNYGVCTADESVAVATTHVSGAQGTGSGFAAFNVTAGGVTAGVILSFAGDVVFNPGETAELSLIDYDILAQGTTSLDICDILGSPPVDVGVADTAAAPFPADGVSGSITGLSPNFLTVGTVTGILGESVTVPVSLTNIGDVAGVQIALTYDDSLVTFDSATASGPAAGSDFFSVDSDVAGILTIGIARDLDATPGPGPIPAGSDVEIVSSSWSIPGTSPAPSTADLTLTDGIGDPVIDNLLIFPDASTEAPNLVSGAINIVNFNSFRRGNCNDDDSDDIGDGIYLLNFLFQSGPDPVCDDACDSNDDGSLDASDAVYLFNYQFLEGPAPLAPFPAEGLDPTTGDGLGCNGDADDL